MTAVARAYDGSSSIEMIWRLVETVRIRRCLDSRCAAAFRSATSAGPRVEFVASRGTRFVQRTSPESWSLLRSAVRTASRSDCGVGCSALVVEVDVEVNVVVELAWFPLEQPASATLEA